MDRQQQQFVPPVPAEAEGVLVGHHTQVRRRPPPRLFIFILLTFERENNEFLI